MVYIGVQGLFFINLSSKERRRNRRAGLATARVLRLKGGSNPLSPINFITAPVVAQRSGIYGREAQPDERHPAQVTAAGSNPASSSTGIVSRNVYLFSFLTAGKDLLRRRVNTVAMRKSATHDSWTDSPPVL